MNLRNRIKLITDSQIVITDSHEGDHAGGSARDGGLKHVA